MFHHAAPIRDSENDRLVLREQRVQAALGARLPQPSTVARVTCL